MPDGKRNSSTAEEETDGFYEEDNIQKVINSSPGKRAPVNFSSKGLNNLSERLLKAMVANEIKKTLDPEDNKKLVANHRPVLHSDNEQSNNGELDNMVVVGVVLNSKQSQSEEISKALELLRKNGITSFCFSLKDSQSPPNGTKKDGGTASPDENSTLPPLDELSPDSPKAEKKVSSPTVSTTSDYASPPPPSPPPEDASCTSTTSPILTNEHESLQQTNVISGKKGGKGNRGKGKAKVETFVGPPLLSPNPPVLFPQAPCTKEPLIVDPLRGDHDRESGPTSSLIEDETEDASASVTAKTATDKTAVRRKKRRKRLYPYVSRRKSKSKKKKVALVVETLSSSVQIEEKVVQETESIVKVEQPVKVEEPKSKEPVDPRTTLAPALATTAIPEKKVDPYEFEDSDFDSNDPSPLETFKTPVGRNSPKKVTFANKKAVPIPTPLPPPKKCPAEKVSKKKKINKKVGSPRKKLTFPKNRPFSPDITDHVTSRQRRGVVISSPQVEIDEANTTIKSSELSSTDSCVQPISAEDDNKKATIIDTDTTSDDKATNDGKSLVLPHPPQGESQLATASSINTPLPLCDDDTDIRANKKEALDESKVPKGDKVGLRPAAQKEKQPSNVQIKEDSTDKNEFLVPPLPSDSLQDSPDSMQLRRSSFYSSISRNVRTNLENYLDGRPQDLKAPKRSKKFKSGFLLHHGDNFPDDPEAPYRLHLATQVLLKLNKRRVKCKPKEDKGKSLLSYLKLQPKRVSRVGKNSLTKHDDGESTSSTGEQTTSVFSGEWTVPRKYICNICGQVETAFWDMVMHKGEVHPGIVVTHVELSDDPPEGFRSPPSPRPADNVPGPSPCTKCEATFTSYSDLHLHIFECAGNLKVLEDNTKVVATTAATGKKKKGKRKRGFKRKINGVLRKNGNATGNNEKPESNIENSESAPQQQQPQTKSAEITKRRSSEVFKCEFCTREFKTEGWLKNHVSLSHSLPISIPLAKLSLPTRASLSSRRLTAQIACNNISKGSKPVCRET